MRAPLLIQEGRRLAPGGGYSSALSAGVVICIAAFFRSLFSPAVLKFLWLFTRPAPANGMCGPIGQVFGGVRPKALEGYDDLTNEQ